MWSELTKSAVRNAFDLFVGDKGPGTSIISTDKDGAYAYEKHFFKVTGKLDLEKMEGILIYEGDSYYFTFDENGNVTDDGDAIKFERYIELDLSNIDVAFPQEFPVKGIEISVAIPLDDKEEKLCFDIELSGIYNVESGRFTVSQGSLKELHDLLCNNATGIDGTYFYHEITVALVDMLSKELKGRFRSASIL